MEMAKWLFSLLIPGVNVFMVFAIDGFIEDYVMTLLGQAILSYELLALVAIFAVFSQLQTLPEVRM